MSWDRIDSWWLEELAGDPAYEEEIEPLVMSLLEPQPDLLYLDLGCGEGRLMRRVTVGGSRVVGCDVSLLLLSKAIRRGPVVQCTLPSLKWLKTASVDGAYVGLVLEHIRDERSFFLSSANVVRPGGVLAVVINHPIWTAPHSSPIEDTGGEMLWRPGTYFGRGFSREPAGGDKVTFYHRTMADLLTSASAAGWDLQRMDERGISPVQVRGSRTWQARSIFLESSGSDGPGVEPSQRVLPVTVTTDLLDDKRLLLFVRLFGIALVAHVVGNWSQPDIPAVVGWVNLIVGGLALGLLWRPAKGLLVLAAAGVVASVLLEMPFTGNHWVLAGLVAAAILLTGGRDDRFFTAARVILLVFYFFAAFAKLNSGFFDPSASCAIFYANQSLSGVGLPPLDTSGIVARALIWMTVAIELSVPITLMWRRTRYVGVVIGTLFHTIISFDLNQHFYDFTAVLIALFVLFLPDEAIESITEQLRGLGRSELVLGKVLLGVVGLLVLMAVSPLTPTTAFLLSRLPFVLWIPLSLLWVVALIRARALGIALNWRVSVGGALVVLIAIMNGLTPYTEAKTAYSFNMYANLVTSQGSSNHYLVPGTWPLRNGYDGPVEILESSDEGLNAYRKEGYLVAYPQLRRYLSLRPDVSITYRRYGVVTTLSEASVLPELVDPGPWWWRFFPLRAIDTRNPPRCQAAFLGAL